MQLQNNRNHYRDTTFPYEIVFLKMNLHIEGKFELPEKLMLMHVKPLEV